MKKNWIIIVVLGVAAYFFRNKIKEIFQNITKKKEEIKVGG